MLRISDLITGDISDSPSDRLAAPFVFALTWPVVVPCAIVYHSAKGIKHLGETIKDKVETKKYYKELKQEEYTQSSAQVTDINESTQLKASITPISKAPKRSNRLILRRNNKN